MRKIIEKDTGAPFPHFLKCKKNHYFAILNDTFYPTDIADRQEDTVHCYFNSDDNAYKNISFEKEAYDNENDMDYLDKREHFSWIEYI